MKKRKRIRLLNTRGKLTMICLLFFTLSSKFCSWTFFLVSTSDAFTSSLSNDRIRGFVDSCFSKRSLRLRASGRFSSPDSALPWPRTRLYKTILFVTFSCIYFFASDRKGQNQITIRSERVYSFTFCYVCFALKILSAYYVITGAPNENIVQNHLNAALLNVF